MKTMIVAIDLDGTITDSSKYNGKGFHALAPPRKQVVDFIRRVHARGHKVVIWTCRNHDEYKDIRKYCKVHEIPIDGINTDKHSPLPESNSTKRQRKIFADFYIDDRAVNLDGLQLIIDMAEKFNAEEKEEDKNGVPT